MDTTLVHRRHQLRSVYVARPTDGKRTLQSRSEFYVGPDAGGGADVPDCGISFHYFERPIQQLKQHFPGGASGESVNRLRKEVMKAFAFLSCLIACSAAMGQTKEMPKVKATFGLTNEQIDIVLNGVRGGLGDPVSARLRAAFAGKDVEGRTWSVAW
jgi:hypothetical protein